MGRLPNVGPTSPCAAAPTRGSPRGARRRSGCRRRASRQHRGEPVRTEALGGHQRADVRGAAQHPFSVRLHRAVRPRVVDRAVGDADAARHRQHVLGPDHPASERPGDRHHLVDRARLERRGHRGSPWAAAPPARRPELASERTWPVFASRTTALPSFGPDLRHVLPQASARTVYCRSVSRVRTTSRPACAGCSARVVPGMTASLPSAVSTTRKPSDPARVGVLAALQPDVPLTRPCPGSRRRCRRP